MITGSSHLCVQVALIIDIFADVCQPLWFSDRIFAFF